MTRLEIEINDTECEHPSLWYRIDHGDGWGNRQGPCDAGSAWRYLLTYLPQYGGIPGGQWDAITVHVDDPTVPNRRQLARLFNVTYGRAEEWYRLGRFSEATWEAYRALWFYSAPRFSDLVNLPRVRDVNTRLDAGA